MSGAVPKCLRCGKIVPAKRRAASDYCTERCARQQAEEDARSAESEREYSEPSKL